MVCSFIIPFIPMHLNCRYLWNSLYFHSSLATLLLKSCAKENYWEHKIIMLDYTLDLDNAILSKRKAMSLSSAAPSAFHPFSSIRCHLKHLFFWDLPDSWVWEKPSLHFLLSHHLCIWPCLTLLCNDQSVHPCPSQGHNLLEG